METFFYIMELMIQPLDAIVLAFVLGISLHIISLVTRAIAIGPLLMKVSVWGEGVKKPFKGNYITRKANLAVIAIFMLMFWGFLKLVDYVDLRQSILGFQTFMDDTLTHIGFWGALPIAIASLALVLSPAIKMLSKRQTLWIGERGLYIQNHFLLWKEIKSIDMESKYLRVKHLEGLHVYDIELDREQALILLSALEHKVKLIMTRYF